MPWYFRRSVWRRSFLMSAYGLWTDSWIPLFTDVAEEVNGREELVDVEKLNILFLDSTEESVGETAPSEVEMRSLLLEDGGNR